MKELLKTLPTGTYEIAAWLIMLMSVLFGYKYVVKFIDYILLKLYEYFIQHKF